MRESARLRLVGSEHNIERAVNTSLLHGMDLPDIPKFLKNGARLGCGAQRIMPRIRSHKLLQPLAKATWGRDAILKSLATFEVIDRNAQNHA